MTKNLRKVKFCLAKIGYVPDLTREEREEEHELGRMRDGYFHRWVDDVDTSKDIPYLKPMALVEDIEDGKMHLVDYYNVTFLK